jgi:hypothetical protein
VAKAEGVFLQVFIVVRSLLRGLTDDNDIHTLQIRLHHLPADLDEHFRRMLDTIEDVYREQIARIFRVVAQAVWPFSPNALVYLEKEKADLDYALKPEIESLIEENGIPTSQKMRNDVNARCKDLLEVNIVESRSDQSGGHYVRLQVDFLHRTVRDFLKTKDVQNLLRSRVAESFDPGLLFVDCLLP